MHTKTFYLNSTMVVGHLLGLSAASIAVLLLAGAAIAQPEPAKEASATVYQELPVDESLRKSSPKINPILSEGWTTPTAPKLFDDFYQK